MWSISCEFLQNDLNFLKNSKPAVPKMCHFCPYLQFSGGLDAEKCKLILKRLGIIHPNSSPDITISLPNNPTLKIKIRWLNSVVENQFAWYLFENYKRITKHCIWNVGFYYVSVDIYDIVIVWLDFIIAKYFWI